MSAPELLGWDRLRHAGLLLDPPRLRRLAEHVPPPLPSFYERELRRQASAVLDGSADVPEFLSFVLKKVCNFSGDNGTWARGPQIGPEWSRTSIAGEAIKPRQLWRAHKGGVLPVFYDNEPRIGIGRGRKAASQVVQWLRAGTERLALLTNGQQWRLIFAGLDFDAYAEWDVDLWFAEGELSPQVTALRSLLSPALWTNADKDAPAPLLQAILDSRKGQAELSAVLGERVREAVELLVQSHNEALNEHCADVDPAEIYRAACRVVMRMVVVLFAESRELLPRDNAIYHGSYGLGGLLEDLEKIAARGGNRLARSWNAWPRVLALFRLVSTGSHHPNLPVPAYGGELFARAAPDAIDGLTRALHVFENACFDRELLSDQEVRAMLERITRTRVKIRQGRTNTWVPAPVDFSDLSSEYIGILYEGLLDFELKTAPSGDPIIFLAVGNQPALPLSRLEAMDDKALANLLEKMKDTSKDEDDEAEASDEASSEEDTPEPEAVEGAEEDDTDESAEAPESVDDTDLDGHHDQRHSTRTRAEVWARRAVVMGKLARKPKGKLAPEKQLAFEHAIGRKARQIVTKVILPGERYLVRWGGTRKGSGTFYTRPGLAIPTVQRTLRPLAFETPIGADGKPDRMAPSSAWMPRRPEEILALKVCDPACGSGTFPVAALRFLTDALYQSLHHHRRITTDGERGIVRLLEGPPAVEVVPGERLADELAPCRPEDAHFEPLLKAILRRHVVERCIYGVDLDPLAVELCRLALWIETMDRTLPFSFLDHKIKCGNGLVGAWFDQFQHYPVMAWKNREGGDKGHSNGVHFEREARTKAIKAFVKEVGPDLGDAVRGQMRLFTPPGGSPADALARARATLARMHELSVQDSDERARLYREEFVGGESYRALKGAMDIWCACWFWPTDEIEHAPLPSTFASPPESTLDVAERVAARKRFFHWELEFPDVFREAGAGFDGVLGNPPWETLQPNSKEFFSDIDPLYRSYGKQEALGKQKEYFGDTSPATGPDSTLGRHHESKWLDYTAGFACDSNWMKLAARPFGDPDRAEDNAERFSIERGNENVLLHKRWRDIRSKSRGFTDPEHPFQHRGEGKAYTYKLFLEQAHALLRTGGRLGFIVPSGLYSDHGTGGLRALFLDRCRWEWLFGFENRDGIFEIHRSFKFNPIIIQKGGSTEAIHTAFMRRKLEDWERAESLATPYTRAQVDQFSPRSKAILEIQSKRDLEILEKVYANSVLLGDEGPNGWGIKYAQGDFNMTSDSKLFPPRTKWEEQGYRPDEYSRWLKGDWRPIAELWAELGVQPLPAGERRCAQPPYDTLPIPRAEIPAGIILSRDADAWIREEGLEDIALPLVQGAMISHLNPLASRHVSGGGASARWDRTTNERGLIHPQFLVAADDFDSSAVGRVSKLAYRRIARTTDARTLIATMLPAWPSGDSVFYYVPSTDHTLRALQLAGMLAALTYDYQVRRRLGGTNLSDFVMSETAVLDPSSRCLAFPAVVGALAGVCLASPALSTNWLEIHGEAHSRRWRSAWAMSDSERLRLRCVIDAVIAAAYGLSEQSVRSILSWCDRPSDAPVSDLDPATTTAFWRVDKDKDPELRHTVLTLVAFHDLEQKIDACGGDQDRGIDAFLSQNDGEGWLLPETLRLADYGLGHDDRAKELQPVASRLGPRFYDWQLAQSLEESWRECHLHARNLLGKPGYLDLLADTLLDKPPSDCAAALTHASDLTATGDLIHVFARPLAALEPSTWRSTLDTIAHLVAARTLPFEASHRATLVERALSITLGERRQPGLRATMDLLSSSEVDAILTRLLNVIERETDTAWRNVIRASINSKRFARLTSGTSVAGGTSHPHPVAAAPKPTSAATPKQTSFFPESRP